MSRQNREELPPPNLPMYKPAGAPWLSSWLAWPEQGGSFAYGDPAKIRFNGRTYSCKKKKSLTDYSRTDCFAKGEYVKVHFTWRNAAEGLYVVKTERNSSKLVFSEKHSLLSKLGRLHQTEPYEKFVGEQLACYLKRNKGKLNIYQCINLAKKIAEAIQKMHDLDYVHCDLKPQNLTFDGKQIHIIDIAEDDIQKFDNYDQAMKGRRGGRPLINYTVRYCAPEIIPFTSQERKNPGLAREREKVVREIVSRNFFGQLGDRYHYVSTTADAYSYGVILRDILKSNYDGCGHDFLEKDLRGLVKDMTRKERKERTAMPECIDRLMIMSRDSDKMKQINFEVGGAFDAINQQVVELRAVINKAYRAMMRDQSSNDTFAYSNEKIKVMRQLDSLQKSIGEGGYWREMAFRYPSKFGKDFEAKFKDQLDKVVNTDKKSYVMKNRKVALALCAFLPLIGMMIFVGLRYATSLSLHKYFWRSSSGDTDENIKDAKGKVSKLLCMEGVFHDGRPSTVGEGRENKAYGGSKK